MRPARVQVWLDGEWQDGPGAWPLDDRGLLFGDAVFETLRVDNGVPRFASLHRARLVRALETMDLASGVGLFDRIVSDVPRLPRAASLRITITAGQGATLGDRKGKPRAFALLRPRHAPPAALRVTVANGSKSSLIPAHLKHPSYLGELLARRAATPHFDDIIVRNAAGRPCELAAANLFAVRKGRSFTPPLGEGVLPGVTRAVVIALARDLKLRVQERPFTMRTLATADELFATSTLLGVCPITQIDGRRLAPGIVTAALQRAYASLR